MIALLLRPWALVERNARAAGRAVFTYVSGFLEPVFYLFALGVGIGTLVGTIDVDGEVMSYAVFVAPAMMATSAMNGAVMDSTFNVFGKIKDAKLYHSVLTTPLSPRDVAVGEIGWALLRGLVYSVAFLLVATLSGFVLSAWAVLTIPVASLIGLAFGSVGMAATTYMRSWNDADYVQLAILPLFLFSATFFPLSTYPPALQWVVQATPLYHGVELIRSLTTGAVHAGMWAHVAYLAVMSALGLWAATRRIERLLLT
ncbi:ABC transporter permease [Pseudactinotalea sp. Z1748]|uniref:ABC transporter permease n=1 Tax=Pseudactinotalea sp. Z1748 TaxID=3413027 RepID=UPI003C7C31D8